MIGCTAAPVRAAQLMLKVLAMRAGGGGDGAVGVEGERAAGQQAAGGGAVGDVGVGPRIGFDLPGVRRGLQEAERDRARLAQAVVDFHRAFEVAA